MPNENSISHTTSDPYYLPQICPNMDVSMFKKSLDACNISTSNSDRTEYQNTSRLHCDFIYHWKLEEPPFLISLGFHLRKAFKNRSMLRCKNVVAKQTAKVYQNYKPHTLNFNIKLAIMFYLGCGTPKQLLALKQNIFIRQLS